MPTPQTIFLWENLSFGEEYTSFAVCFGEQRSSETEVQPAVSSDCYEERIGQKIHPLLVSI
jgi:hypothetical protein